MKPFGHVSSVHLCRSVLRTAHDEQMRRFRETRDERWAEAASRTRENLRWVDLVRTAADAHRVLA